MLTVWHELEALQGDLEMCSENLEIVEECRRKDDEGEIEGHFILSDGTKVLFCITDVAGQLEWFQWGATTEKLGVTVDRVEALTQEARNAEL